MRDVLINICAWIIAPLICLTIAIVAVLGLASLMGGMARLLLVVGLGFCSLAFWGVKESDDLLYKIVARTLSIAAMGCAVFSTGVFG